MSNTVTPTMTLSSSYVPRNRDGSRPASPALSSSYRPRPRRAEPSGDASPAAGSSTPILREGAGSRLKHELKEVKVEPEILVLDEATLQNARDILDLLSALPYTLPEALPNKSLKRPRPISKTDDTFTEYVHAFSASGTSRKLSLEREDDGPLIGLGLSLESRTTGPGAKRRRMSPSEVAKNRREQARGDTTPTVKNGQRPGPSRRQSGGKGNGNGHGNGHDGDIPMTEWSKERWERAGHEWMARAVLSKRHGDAMQRAPNAKPEFVEKLPHDPISGYLAIVDSILLFLYAYWCNEQSGNGLPKYQPYAEATLLMESSRAHWTMEMRRADLTPAQREMNKGMTGLLFLIEAMAQNQMCMSQHLTLRARHRELSAQTPSNPSSTPAETADHHHHQQHHHQHHSHSQSHHHHHNGMSAPSSATKGPSPSGSSTSPPEGGHTGPSPMSSNTSEGIPADIIPLMASVTETMNKANSFLQTSRFYLSLPILREHFPKTYDIAISTDLSDLALPIPGDTIGSGKCVDPDQPDQFAWPIELGMSAGIPHLVAFGRSMIEEYAEIHGLRYTKKIHPF